MQKLREYQERSISELRQCFKKGWIYYQLELRKPHDDRGWVDDPNDDSGLSHPDDNGMGVPLFTCKKCGVKSSTDTLKKINMP